MTVVTEFTAQLERIRDALIAVGYDRRAIVDNYDYAYRNGQSGSAQVDLVAFSDPKRHDLQTSCMAAKALSSSSNPTLEMAKLPYLAVPIVLLPREREVELWSIQAPTRESTGSVIDRIGYDSLVAYFYERRSWLRSDSIIAAKNGQIQLGFLDVDPTLVHFAYEATRNLLVSHFESAVRVGTQATGVEKVSTPLVRLALQLLAAAILEDKRALGNERTMHSARLLDQARELQSAYFTHDELSALGPMVGDLMVHELRRQITFRSFSNEMLGHFYEHTFVTEEIRKDLGIYYTPPMIAKRIVTRLPIEEIPPESRTVLDGTCGSGSLLVAAFERLQRLLPADWSHEQAHAYLVRHLQGVDSDSFATEVTRLSLFLMDFPGGDRWNVRPADFLELPLPKKEQAPRIIVANPPFKELRSVGGRRWQRAAVLLERYLDWLAPGGLIGIVLPEAFLENESCKSARTRLLNECDILELWRLPEGTFPSSAFATAILLARKLGPRGQPSTEPVRVERVGRSMPQRQEFFAQDRPTESYVFSSQETWRADPEARMHSSLLEPLLWSRLRTTRSLGQVAEIRNGIIPGSSRAELALERRSLEWKPWLEGAASLQPYHIRWNGLYIRYPGNLHRPRPKLAPVFEAPNVKVLLNANRAPGNPWRLYAAVDRLGYYPSQGIHCAMPKDGTSLEELAAVLNSPFASAWADSFIRHRWITESTLETMPYPQFSVDARQRVSQLVRALEKSRKEAEPSLFARSEPEAGYAAVISTIDELVLDAYGVDADGREAIQRLFTGHHRPGLGGYEVRAPGHETRDQANDGRVWTVTGQVLDVLPQDGAVRLWISGYNGDEPFSAKVPEAMPGWALRRERAFQAKLPWELRQMDPPPIERLVSFRPLEFSYASTEELLGLVSEARRLS
jgi:hypothetical protein